MSGLLNQLLWPASDVGDVNPSGMTPQQLEDLRQQLLWQLPGWRELLPRGSPNVDPNMTTQAPQSAPSGVFQNPYNPAQMPPLSYMVPIGGQAGDAPWVQNLKRLVQPNVDPRAVVRPQYQNTDPMLNRLGPQVGNVIGI